MTQLTHGECAPVTRRRTCPSPTRRELWRLVRIILRNRRVHSHRPDNGRRRRLHARKQMRMVGADARSMQSPRTMHRRQSRPDDADSAWMRASIAGSTGRSHLRDRNNGYVVVTERQKSGSILEPHRFESGPLHGGSRVNSDVGSGRTAPARSDLAQRVRHGIRNSHADARDHIEVIRYGLRFEHQARKRMPAAPGKALPFGYSVCCECSHRSFLVRRAPDERTNGRVYTPET